MASKCQLRSGETWSGSGRTAFVFAAWEKDAEVKVWRTANEGENFPVASGVASTLIQRGVAGKGRKAPARKAYRRAEA